MILSSDQIRKELQDIWCDYQWEFPKNPCFSAIPDALFPEIMERCSIVGMFQAIPGIWECENYSGEWQSRVRRLQYEWWMSGKHKPKWRWYVSDVVGIENDFMGNAIKHSKNLIRLESGWVLVEPQTDAVSRNYQSFYPFLGEA